MGKVRGQGKIKSQRSKVKGQSLRRTGRLLIWLLCWLLSATVVWAQDGVPVPPLEAGWILTLHPVFVHFATALTVFGGVLDCGGSICRHSQWQDAGRLCFLAGVIAMGLSVLSGWIEQQLPQPSSVFDSQIQKLLIYHEYLGYGLLGFFVVLSVIRIQIDGRLPVFFIMLMGIGLGGLAVQGHWGGELVYRYGTAVRAVHILSNQKTDGQNTAAPKDSPKDSSEAASGQ